MATAAGRGCAGNREYCDREQDELLANGVRVTAVGRRDRLPRSARGALERLERASAQGGRLHLRLAIDYSSQWMIAETARRIAEDVAAGRRDAAGLTPEILERTLTDGVPPVDLLVRTAGEQRLSDFLLWEVAYAELYFTKVLWPDFRRDHLAAALGEFRRRERRFGGLVPVVTVEPEQALRVAAG
jgi:undecaprenyl diphosphate synthase